MEVILDVSCLVLGVSDRALLHGVVEKLNSLLLIDIGLLKLGNELLFLLFQLFCDLTHLLSFLVSSTDFFVVLGIVFKHQVIIHFGELLLGLTLALFHRLVRLLQSPIVFIFSFRNDCIILLSFDSNYSVLAFVSAVNVVLVLLDSVYGPLSLLVE